MRATVLVTILSVNVSANVAVVKELLHGTTDNDDEDDAFEVKGIWQGSNFVSLDDMQDHRRHEGEAQIDESETVDVGQAVAPDGSVSAVEASGSAVRRHSQPHATSLSQKQTGSASTVRAESGSVLRRVAQEAAEVPPEPVDLMSDLDKPVLLIYDPIDLTRKHVASEQHILNLLTQVRASGWPYQLVGNGTKWEGWGSKTLTLITELRKLDNKQLVIIPDSRDVLINTAPGGMKSFVENFKKVSSKRPGAVVASADATCCAAAMNHAGAPGMLILADGSRWERACTSGFGDCVHKGDAGDAKWKQYFDRLAADHGHEHARFPYLNGQVVAGRAGDLVRVYEFLQIDAEEDDQALLSEAIFRRPTWLMLDYDQRLFGTNSFPFNEHPWHHHHAAKESGCLYDWEKPDAPGSIGYFKSRVTGHAPLFIHTSGKFFNCYKKIQK
eukprot:gnl/MRDRNA2_/MRDRNA2_108079_c0_seq1.p1 gnl/MRDRNA2_/MRDRNA2_108079_c0~~gnl/MRDRNA2_/MRDRNA2_108079_c0_seq1.p1  ORF type:complete len:442 (-),score=81.53 gnl/MRDRNA2_/MRDRNA2_108079_c0_seq1:59-1384(-)